MPKLRDLRAVDASYARTGPNATALRQSIPRSAANYFEALKTPEAWTPLDIEVIWTTPEPYGVGSERTATGRSGLIIEEHVVTWEQGRRMGWRFDATTLPLAAFCEEFELNPTGNDFCELVWYYAYEMAGPLPAATAKVFGTVFKTMGQRNMAGMAAWAEANIAATEIVF